jgi:trimethylamine--corrinoid protein Co-methyltransferase
MLELGLTLDYAKIVMDSEIITMVRQVIKGIKVDDENLAVDIIRQVGPAGEFITNSHTFRHFKSVQSQSSLFDRRMRGAWDKDGSKDLTERCYEKAGDILHNHRPTPLSPGVASTIHEIIADAEKEFKVK